MSINSCIRSNCCNSRSRDRYRSYDYLPHYASGRTHDHSPHYTSGWKSKSWSWSPNTVSVITKLYKILFTYSGYYFVFPSINKSVALNEPVLVTVNSVQCIWKCKGSMISLVYYVDMNDALSVTRKLPTIFWLAWIKSVRTCLGWVYRNHTQQHPIIPLAMPSWLLILFGVFHYKITKP